MRVGRILITATTGLGRSRGMARAPPLVWLDWLMVRLCYIVLSGTWVAESESDPR